MNADEQPPETPHETQPAKHHKRWPRGAAIWGFVAAVALYAVQATVTGFWSLHIEQARQQGAQALEADRFRAQLITLAASANTVDERLERLQFFLDLGLLEDKGGKIKAAIDAKKVPKLPAHFITPGAAETEGEPGNIFSRDVSGHRSAGTPGALEAVPERKQ